MSTSLRGETPAELQYRWAENLLCWWFPVTLLVYTLMILLLLLLLLLLQLLYYYLLLLLYTKFKQNTIQEMCTPRVKQHWSVPRTKFNLINGLQVCCNAIILISKIRQSGSVTLFYIFTRENDRIKIFLKRPFIQLELDNDKNQIIIVNCLCIFSDLNFSLV